MKIGFIGLGNMGASLAKLSCRPRRVLRFSLPIVVKLRWMLSLPTFGGQASSNEEIFAEADVIFLGC